MMDNNNTYCIFLYLLVCLFYGAYLSMMTSLVVLNKYEKNLNCVNDIFIFK